MSLPERPAVDVDLADIGAGEQSARHRRDPSLARLELPTACHFAGYEVIGRMAVGGMAEVFLARERGEAGSSRHVVLKVIRAQFASSPELAELFLQEGRVALGLGHPNICHTLRFGTEQGRPFLAMELIGGVTLRALFTGRQRGGPTLSDGAVVRIVADVAEALHSAHVAKDATGRSLGLVHQDVSPQNVMVAYDGTVKLLDFGVASTSAERAATAAVEQSQVFVRGKAAYLSPEQCGGRGVDARSDVFSLGIVLYEMLTGARLFARASSAETMRAIACERLPAWPRTIPDALARVLDRALAHDEADRYPSADAMQEDLESFLVDGGHVVTSRTISRELQHVLGADYGRAPAVDTSSEGLAWLRSESETQVRPIPLVSRRNADGRARALVAMIVVAVALLAGWIALPQREVAPETPSAPSVSIAHGDAPAADPAPRETVPATSIEAVAAEPAPTPAPAPPPRRSRTRARPVRGAMIHDLDF
jgi:serine/threonine protein kinase